MSSRERFHYSSPKRDRRERHGDSSASCHHHREYHGRDRHVIRQGGSGSQGYGIGSSRQESSHDKTRPRRHDSRRHIPQKRSREKDTDLPVRHPKEPKLDSEQDTTPGTSKISGISSATISPTTPKLTYTSSPPKQYYQEREGVLCGTGALRELHAAFTKKLLQTRDTPAVYRLICLEDAELGKDDIPPSSPNPEVHSSGATIDDIPPSSFSSPNPEVHSSGATNDAVSEGCTGEGVESERGYTFHRKPSIHGFLCSNVPTKGTRVRPPQCSFAAESGIVPSKDLCVHPKDYYHYRISLSPEVNFKASRPTAITTSGGKTYSFEGFSVISAVPLDNVPPCMFQCYGCDYTIHLAAEPLPQNFTVQDVLLFEDYLFVSLLELYDLAVGGVVSVSLLELYDLAVDLKPFGKTLLMLPRFVSPEGDCHDILPMSGVLNYLLETYKPLAQSCDRGNISWQTYGLLVTFPKKRPSCIRVDRLEFAGGMPPKIVHFSSHFNDQGHPPKNEKYQKSASTYAELQKKASKGKLKRREHFEMREVKHKLRRQQTRSEAVVEFSGDGAYSTGLYTDIMQHALVIPIIAHHILFHDSLHTLEDKLHYHFRDRQLLQKALTHPSYVPLFSTTEDHVRNIMSNCGLKRLEHMEANDQGQRQGVQALAEAVEGGTKEGEEGGKRITHNEQLEFLGDAVLEFLCSLHLYHVFPSLTDGGLTAYRRPLVKNKHLAIIAHGLDLRRYMLVASNVVLSSECVYNHSTANCLEALLGAVFLDGGLPAAQRLLAQVLFPEEDLYNVWMNYPPDPLQQQHPEGDRHLIPQFEYLQRLVPLEQSVGVEFSHIRLLARAFTHSSVGYTNLTMGSYQRMEFLGDAVLQFLASHYVYQCLPSHHEGHLSLLRMSLVHNKQLAKLSKELGFDKYILTSKTEEVELSSKLLADVVESFLAALLLDKGLVFAKRFLEVCLFPKLGEIVRSSQLVDANTRLHQAAVHTCKREGTKTEMPQYRTLRTEGPSNKPIFTGKGDYLRVASFPGHTHRLLLLVGVAWERGYPEGHWDSEFSVLGSCPVGVYFRERRIAVGSGPTIREARTNAAESALASGLLILHPSQRTGNPEK